MIKKVTKEEVKEKPIEMKTGVMNREGGLSLNFS